MTKMDFNGDGRDDILWQNTQTGHVTNWLGQPNGSFIANEEAGLDPWAVGSLVAVGDFNDDGRSDTLWRTDNGELFLSLTLPDGVFFYYWTLGFVASVSDSWIVAGTGDFNGDGRDDLLWRHESGIVTDWLSQDGDFYGNHANAAYAVSSAWHVAGTGDFNGDGRDDILWRHDNGTVTDWLGQADGSFIGNFAAASAAAGSAWHVAGTGDFNGDGRDDILWRHDNGTVTNWLGQADGSFVGNFGTAAYAADPSWQVEGTGDFNGDGRDDVLWRHESGIVTDWLGQAAGTFLANYPAAAYAVDLAWQIQPNLSGAGEWDY